MTVYLDCNATTPVEPRIAQLVTKFLVEEFGNAGSRTHIYGNVAKKAVNEARRALALLVDADETEVFFTSGATESNNIALLGMMPALKESGKTHIISTEIEHKAVLEPLERFSELGFEVELLSPETDGRISPDVMAAALRDDTGLVSMMQVNNETGAIQPVEEIGAILEDHEAYLHIDAAQGFGKLAGPLPKRVDLISISGHKLYAPKGVGALVARRRGFDRPPIRPLMVGGGQERGYRPGTQPVHLIVGLGEAARIAAKEHSKWTARCLELRDQLIECLAEFDCVLNGDLEQTISSTLSTRLPGIDAEAALICLKEVVAISNGAACTSASYQTSHVLSAMGLTDTEARETLRWSWCHMTPDLPVQKIQDALSLLKD